LYSENGHAYWVPSKTIPSLSSNFLLPQQNTAATNSLLLTPDSGKEMRDNIISVFGAALNQQLIPVSKDITFQSTKTQKSVR